MRVASSEAGPGGKGKPGEGAGTRGLGFDGAASPGGTVVDTRIVSLAGVEAASRAERIDSLRAAVNAGSYEIDLDLLAEKILEREFAKEGIP